MIRMENVTFSYDGRANVLSGAEAVIESGLTLCLGVNGCGKSTLLKLAAGVEFPDTGRVLVGGHDLWRDEVAARRSLAYLPEHPDLTPYATIRDVMGLVCRLRRESPARGAEALAAAGLEALADRSVRELSQGQRRRALFATLLIGQPEHILLDEPLEAMDRRIRGEIMAWIGRRIEAGATVVVVSHTLEPFAAAADAALTIEDGKIRTWGDLPRGPDSRLRLLERLARSEAGDVGPASS
jgi:ABC-type multidrug transport system ATPase subunit